MREYSIKYYLDRHEQYLLQLIEQQNIPALRLKDAIHYVLFPGGKRLRPLLVYLTGHLLNTSMDCLDTIAASIELTHCYSLVHDDLPGMDNDDLRRGKPTCHCMFDEATAILTGDSLQILAIDILLEHLPHQLEPRQVIAVVQELIRASGATGMISGQYFDLHELNNPVHDEARLRGIHQLKTGQLILACINMTIAASHPSVSEIQALRRYANHLGLVFQIQDDYMDHYVAPSVLGKNRASDQENAKSTFADFYSKEALALLIHEQYDYALQSLQCFGEKANLLRELTNHLKIRNEKVG